RRSGKPDPTFRTANGIVRIDFPGYFSFIVSCVAASRGKILIGGSAAEDSDARHVGLVRFNADGSLDTSFGKGGFVIDDFSWEVGALAVDDNGKILAGGSNSPESWPAPKTG